MHVVFRESHGLEETDTPTDLGQSPGDLVVLSFSDSDLGAFAAGWHGAKRDAAQKPGKSSVPSLRLANLAALRHPISVDTYIDKTLAGARGILIRIIGGESYWRYGLQQLADLALTRSIALAVIPADGREDPSLDAFSTLPIATLRRLAQLCDAGGPAAARAALAQLALAAGFDTLPVLGRKIIPNCGWYDPDQGVDVSPPEGEGSLAIIVFYRAYLTAADTQPVDAMIGAMRRRGFRSIGLYVPSLKAPDAALWVQEALLKTSPAAIINVTAFSARGENGSSPLDAAGCPVFQAALSTAVRSDWMKSERGLSPADLAMHVALPEVDGRIFAGVISFKTPGERDLDLQFARMSHLADADRVDAAGHRVALWTRLATTAAADKRLAVVLSTYPGRTDKMAHAVGLDALASTERMMRDLAAAGYAVEPGGQALGVSLGAERLSWPIAAYRQALQHLPEALRGALTRAWGEPEDDPAAADGAMHFAATRRGHALIALQPERGTKARRDDEYHDLSRTPRHAYVAFYLWLRAQDTHALIHVGAHGTLEWLPGKTVALSQECWPEALVAGLPVIYPFIVNDPGEAAQAKRRLGALTLGHLPPPPQASSVPPGLLDLERLLDEYSVADGLDPLRRDRLVAHIRAEAQASGVEQDLALSPDASAAEAIVRIDRFVCDIKESQFGDGLHIFGQGAGEREGLFRALSGKRVEPGPSGSPWRGRDDVVPTGRNLYAVDPRAVPTRTAHAQGVKLAEELIRRHLQDFGDYPRSLVVDLWGSATMRSAGEEFAMALHLAGLAPRWDPGSERVSGFEILPPVLVARPRIDVTLRVSGLFRDIFMGLAQMFEAASAALALRDEPSEENPYAIATPRVFGPRPGHFGLGLGTSAEDYSDEGRAAAGEAWLSQSSWSINSAGEVCHDRAALEARLRGVDGFAHVQDLPETDVLLAADYPAHEGGIAAAMATLGAPSPALYHLDATRPGDPRARRLSEEIARVVRARAANSAWADGMMRHGFRGAAEITETLDNLAAFAHLTRDVPAHLFDLYFEATLGRDEVVLFMQRENPAALAALRARFRALADSTLWITRRNSIVADLGEAL